MRTIYFYSEEKDHDTFIHALKTRLTGDGVPYLMLIEEIEKAGYRFRHTRSCKELPDCAAILLSWVSWDGGVPKEMAHYPKERCFNILAEPPTRLAFMYDPKYTQLFGTIFTPLDHLVDHKKFFKYYNPVVYDKVVENIPDFSAKKLCVMIQSNEADNQSMRYKLDYDYASLNFYPVRRAVAAFFRDQSEFDLYGRMWHGYPAWRGPLSADKMTVLKHYKFCFCFENTRDLPGYVSDRIFDAMYGGCVPIYRGASNITDYVPKECFVDLRNFQTVPELLCYMRGMDRATYESYLAAGQAFLRTARVEPFTFKNFVRTIMERLLTIRNL